MTKQATNQGWKQTGSGNYFRPARKGEMRTAEVVVIDGIVWAASAQEAIRIDERAA